MQTQKSKNSQAGLIGLLVILTGSLWLVNSLQLAPKAKSISASKQDFSAHRAIIHVEKIAAKPHPAGSIANAEVRDYLINTLQGFGAEVEVQRRLQTYKFIPRAGQARFGYVENVVARFQGRKSNESVLLLSHYDSVPNSPGAGDNASGVAAALETVRAIIATEIPLKNTLIVLFSDAEERGMLGSQAFFDHHRWAEQVNLVLNVDSRGSRGPVIMYQTSEYSGLLVDKMTQVVKSPMATSLVNSIFGKLPFYSDFSIAMKSGKHGLNFAFIDGFNDYHASSDTADRISLDSIQHLGEYILPLIQYFGNIELPIVSEANNHYFNPLGDMLLNYPAWLDWVIWLLSASCLLLADKRSRTSGEYTLGQLVQGFCFAFLVLMMSAIFILLADRIVDQIVDTSAIIARQMSWFVAWDFLAIGSLILLFGVVRQGGRRLRIIIYTSFIAMVFTGGLNYSLLITIISIGVLFELVLIKPLLSNAIFTGSLFLVLFMAIVVLLLLPGAAHVLTWSLLPIVVMKAWRFRGIERRPLASLLLIFGLPALILLSGTALMFDQLIGYDLPLVSVLPLLISLLFFTPIMDTKLVGNIGGIILVFGIVALTWLVVSNPWNEQHPQVVTQFVLHDENKNSTYWASDDPQLTKWHRRSLGNNPSLSSSTQFQPDTNRPVWLNRIGKTKVLLPNFELLNVDKKHRYVNFRVKPAYAGDTIIIWLDPTTVLYNWSVNGQPLQNENNDYQGWYSLAGFAIPKEGVEITFEFEPESDWPELLIVNVQNRLPDGLIRPTRSAVQMRGSSRSHSDETVSFRNIALAELIANR